MNIANCLLFLFGFSFSFFGSNNYLPDSLNWIKIDSNFQLLVKQHLRPSVTGDGNITLIRFKPDKYVIDLISFKENKLNKTADYWTDTLNYTLVFNAGMYDLADETKHRFYMRNKSEINNSHIDLNANGAIAFNRLNDSVKNFNLFDLTINKIVDIEKDYQTIIQGYRLIDNSGMPVYWLNNDQFCSMSVIAQDTLGYIYLIFSRSPLSQNQMIENLLSLRLNLKNSIYLEGGSKACFSIRTQGIKMKKMGSYVSNYYPFDDNIVMPNFPNFIGIKNL